MGGNGFRLQPVLNYRQSTVELREMELARLLNILHQAEDTLARLVALRDRVAEQIRNECQGTFDPDTAAQHRSYLEWVRSVIAFQTQKVREARAQVNAKRNELTLALQEQKVLEKLKEHTLARQAAAAERAESNLLNELTTAKFNRHLQERRRVSEGDV
ncbi:MAG TPA: flagellar export protein FliJ [Anaerolineae bacterium]|nr:flagellar export protein FliJ [Anaerolineae bacterium]